MVHFLHAQVKSVKSDLHEHTGKHVDKNKWVGKFPTWKSSAQYQCKKYALEESTRHILSSILGLIYSSHKNQTNSVLSHLCV